MHHSFLRVSEIWPFRPEIILLLEVGGNLILLHALLFFFTSNVDDKLFCLLNVVPYVSRACIVILVKYSRELEHGPSFDILADLEELIGLLNHRLRAINVPNSAFSRAVDHLVRNKAAIDLLLLNWLSDRLEVIDLKYMSRWVLSNLGRVFVNTDRLTGPGDTVAMQKLLLELRRLHLQF